jgi:hypothetical protein
VGIAPVGANGESGDQAAFAQSLLVDLPRLVGSRGPPPTASSAERNASMRCVCAGTSA